MEREILCYTDMRATERPADAEGNRRHKENLGKNSCYKSGCKFSERRGKVIQHAGGEERVGQSEAERGGGGGFCIGLSLVPHEKGLLAFHEIKFTEKEEKDFVTICGRNPKEREGLTRPG